MLLCVEHTLACYTISFCNNIKYPICVAYRERNVGTFRTLLPLYNHSCIHVYRTWCVVYDKWMYVNLNILCDERVYLQLFYEFPFVSFSYFL